MPKLKVKTVRAARVADSDIGLIVGESLKLLREQAGLTQKEVAARLRVGQTAISKIEHRGDIHIRSLQRYVEALGATLRIEATAAKEQALASRSTPLFDPDTPDDDQLVFPIFGDEVFGQHRDIVLSIRPQYTDKIMQGQKTVELRRRFPIFASRGTIAYIYCTSPVRAMVGSAEITHINKLSVPQIWRKFGKSASVSRADFDAYFEGLNEGFALHFANVRPFPRRLDLSELRDRFDFEPPQSFLYATPVLRRALLDEFPGISN